MNKTLRTFICELDDRWVAWRNYYKVKLRRAVPTIVPYISYGSCENGNASVKIMLRCVLSKKTGNSSPLSRGIRALMTSQLPGVVINVFIDDEKTPYRVYTDRRGFVRYDLQIAASEGWHDVKYQIANDYVLKLNSKRKEPITIKQELMSKEVHSKVLIVENKKQFAILSDIDDTVMVSQVPSILRALYYILFSSPHKRRHVQGMPEFFEFLRNIHNNAPVFWLSAAPWNMFPMISKFITSHNLPFGPLLLQDIGPSSQKLFESTSVHKRSRLDEMFERFPNVKWILVGDNGQHDPSYYREIAQKYPGHVEAIIIRELSSVQHVLAHGLPFEVSGTGKNQVVPIFYAKNGFALLRLCEKYVQAPPVTKPGDYFVSVTTDTIPKITPEKLVEMRDEQEVGQERKQND